MATQPRTPPERSGTYLCPRDERGRLLPSGQTALQRFAAKCDFDPTTGCVVWCGGTTAGRGNSAVYGSFRDGPRRWYAHRWSAVHIHGLDIDGKQVGHCCPHTGGKPNTLCVEHVQAQTQLENLTEQMARGAGAVGLCMAQSNDERQHWLFVSLAIRPAPPVYVPDPSAVPFYEPPRWFLEARPDYQLPPLSDVPF